MAADPGLSSMGQGAMVLGFDIAPEAQVEHDHWHSQEHLPERLALPGFLRGSRWASVSGGPGYLVIYEVSDLDALESAAYLARLNQPSPWTTRMMPFYRGMQRGLCRVVSRAGQGLGGHALTLRFSVAEDRRAGLRAWIAGEALPLLAASSGLVSAALFESGLQADLTAEQRIRGRDGSVDLVLLVTGHARANVQAAATDVLAPEALLQRGALAARSAVYQLAHVLGAADVPGAGTA